MAELFEWLLDVMLMLGLLMYGFGLLGQFSKVPVTVSKSLHNSEEKEQHTHKSRLKENDEAERS